jgi:hypothetical protein
VRPSAADVVAINSTWWPTSKQSTCEEEALNHQQLLMQTQPAGCSGEPGGPGSHQPVEPAAAGLAESPCFIWGRKLSRQREGQEGSSVQSDYCRGPRQLRSHGC